MTEYQHQCLVFRWAAQPSIKERFPELRLLHHIKNETASGAKAVAIDRANGVKKGVPDLCLPVARGGYHGLYIEMKTERGKVSSEQTKWISDLLEQGYYAEVCHGWQEATDLIERYMNDF